MEFVKTVQLKTLEEILADGGVSYEETGLYKLNADSFDDWVNPLEISNVLGKEVNVFKDSRDESYDLIVSTEEYDEDSAFAIYALDSYDWLVKED